MTVTPSAEQIEERKRAALAWAARVVRSESYGPTGGSSLVCRDAVDNLRFALECLAADEASAIPGDPARRADRRRPRPAGPAPVSLLRRLWAWLRGRPVVLPLQRTTTTEEWEASGQAAEWRKQFDERADVATLASRPVAVVADPGPFTKALLADDWNPWPPLHWPAEAERKLRRITGSRGLQAPDGWPRGKPRPVIDPAGVRHASLRQAARANGTHQHVIWRWLNGTGCNPGYRYAD